MFSSFANPVIDFYSLDSCGVILVDTSLFLTGPGRQVTYNALYVFATCCFMRAGKSTPSPQKNHLRDIFLITIYQKFYLERNYKNRVSTLQIDTSGTAFKTGPLSKMCHKMDISYKIKQIFSM